MNDVAFDLLQMRISHKGLLASGHQSRKTEFLLTHRAETENISDCFSAVLDAICEGLELSFPQTMDIGSEAQPLSFHHLYPQHIILLSINRDT